MYINEIIRITYKCNWKCKFCNVYKTNNFGDNDISSKEVVKKILSLANKYTYSQRKKLILSFSGGEPTINNNLLKYIELAKKIGIGTVEIQTNGSNLFKNRDLILHLIDAGLDEIFLAQHSHNSLINKKLGCYYDVNMFIDWVKFIKEKSLHHKVGINLNIVVNKINLMYIYDYINFLLNIGFIDLIPKEYHNNNFCHKISFGLVQPNGYAYLNKEEVLLKYNDNELFEIEKIIKFCENNNIFPDFHFTSPPLCVLNYPNYNLEYKRLRRLFYDKLYGNINKENLKSYSFLWKEKIKFKECNFCKYNLYCLGFYRNWIDFVGKKYALKFVKRINNLKI